MFGGGGGGLNPRKMQQMMEQMGIDVDELDAEEVIIRTADEELVFENPDVTKMNARGQETYQVVGEPTSRDPGSTTAESADASAVESADDGGDDFDADDVALVAQRAGVSEDDAREALAAADGDLAAAIAALE
jgi:nascent polypeptide-associated complex subunit alpha